MTYVIMGGNGEIIEHFMVDYWMETLIEAQIRGVIEDALRTQNNGGHKNMILHMMFLGTWMKNHVFVTKSTTRMVLDSKQKIHGT